MNVIEGPLPGLLLIEPAVHADHRGWLVEVWSDERYAGAGVSTRFVQDNLSFSRRGALRGLHFQHPHGQAKLVSVLDGEVFDVAVDIRVGSPTFGRWHGCTLSSANHRQLFVPPDFAHGFQVTSEHALVSYKCGEYYRPEVESTILWSDPDLGIAWPDVAPILSARDRAGARLREIEPSRLPAAG
ncbi:MAG: dTDP-4-dehydrorhamnose 3,5-epimerase [Longimicrobiales bacterium]